MAYNKSIKVREVVGKRDMTRRENPVTALCCS